METMHPVLLIGAYDWDAERLPIVEFEDRLAALRREMDARGWRAVVLYGSSRDHGALAYFTNFTPKLRPAFAFVPRDGEIRLIADGGGRMLPASQVLTWVSDVRAAGDFAKQLGEWVGDLDLGDGGATIGLSGIDRMPAALHGEVVAALERRFTVEDAEEMLAAMMRNKRPRERALLDQGCAIVSRAREAVAEAHGAGAPVVEAMLAGERAARALEAADVRLLYSLDEGRTLRPFEGLSETRCDTLVGYLAVKYRGYWAEGFMTLAAAPSAAQERARAALDAVSAALAPGVTGRELAREAAARTGGLATHPAVDRAIGHGIGLAMEEAPMLGRGGDQPAEAGDVCSLRIGITDGEAGHAIVSAMVAVGLHGAEVLWSS